MESHAMIINWNTQYSQDLNSPQSPYIGFIQFLSSSQQDNLICIDKIVLKDVWKGRGTRTAETILKNKNKVEGISPSNAKIYYITTVIKTLWY